MNAAADCEAALAAHWSQLGRLPRSQLHEEAGIVWFETPIRHLPYNGVVRTELTPESADEVIARVLGRSREREVELWWVDHPSATPADLGERLVAAGLDPVERMNFMALDLEGWVEPGAGDVEVRPVSGEDDLRHYTALGLRYWEITPDSPDADVVADLYQAILGAGLPGQAFLALLDGTPVAKAYLSWPGPPGVASLYGMSVVSEARGRGVAQTLTAAMMLHARDRGLRRCVLHATDMAVGVYSRIGFARCGEATVHATAPVWSDP